jgi:hypothetical protein
MTPEPWPYYRAFGFGLAALVGVVVAAKTLGLEGFLFSWFCCSMGYEFGKSPRP